MINSSSILASTELLNQSLAAFTQKVQDFVVNPKERYNTEYSGVHFATPKFTADLIELINMAHDIFNNPTLDALQKTTLENGLYQLSKTLARAECDRNIANSIAEEEDAEIKEQITASCERDFAEKYQDLAAFKAFAVTAKHLSTFRLCFPTDASVYDKFFPNPDIETKQYIAICKQIKAHINLYKKLYVDVFALTNPGQKVRAQVKKKLDIEQIVEHKPGPKRHKSGLQ